MRTTATPGSLRGPPVVLWAAACLGAAGSTTRPVSAQPPPPELVGEMRLFSTSRCPPGWEEVNATKGFVLTGRPEGGENATNGAPALGPMERGRVGPHAHAVPQHDVTIHDPGHGHELPPLMQNTALRGNTDIGGGGYHFPNKEDIHSQISKSDITATDPGTTTNQAGSDYLPLAYVLVCQRVTDDAALNQTEAARKIEAGGNRDRERITQLENELATYRKTMETVLAKLERMEHGTV